ncbi:hypothetical protein HOD29_03465 [archaeon]|jgi:hypothetical protein|nr:hypothetical protein [archaeon]
MEQKQEKSLSLENKLILENISKFLNSPTILDKTGDKYYAHFITNKNLSEIQEYFFKNKIKVENYFYGLQEEYHAFSSTDLNFYFHKK